MREVEKNAEKREIRRERKRHAHDIEKKSAQSCQERDREEREYNVNEIIYSCLQFL